MDPTKRTLQVLEYIMSTGLGPIKQVDIAHDCGMSPATMNRVIRSLSDWGYLFRTSEKYVVRNFRLDRNVPMSEDYLAKLDDAMRRLSAELNVSAEVVVVAGHVVIKVGTLGDPGSFGKPSVAIFAKDIRDFHSIPEGLEVFEKLPPMN